MNGPSDRLINLFGALALGLTDRVRSTTVGEIELGGESAAALVVIGHVPGLSIDQLRRVLRLTHPGTVRLVDRLTRADFALRTRSPRDRRSVVLTLTELGRTHRATLLDRRHEAVSAVLNAVASEDRDGLERIARAMLQALPHDANSALHVCRLCDGEKCIDCPMDIFGTIS